MKRSIITLALVLVVALLTGCAGSSNEKENNKDLPDGNKEPDQSEGSAVGGFPQGVADLDFALRYVKA